MSDLQSQYENYPYPPCDPDNEVPGATRTLANDLETINQYVYGGRRKNFADFQALVAGGGTGFATVHLAEQLARISPAATVTHIDLSASSIAIARRRIEKLGLSNVRFIQGSFLDREHFEPGTFDYINCSGVLHHLKDPPAGARALTALLREDGGMSIMLYAALGRMGIYPVQDMLKMLMDEPPRLDKMVDVCRSLLAELPPTNWLYGSGSALTTQDDAELVDKFLHIRDRAYRVPEIYELVQEAGLRLVSFMPPMLYDPMPFIRDEELRNRVLKLSLPERQAFAELLQGSKIMFHLFYVVRSASAA